MWWESRCGLGVLSRCPCENELEGKEVQIAVVGNPFEGIVLDIQIQKEGEVVERHSVRLHE